MTSNTKDNILLSPWWVTGIADGEGNFSINFNKNTKKVTFSFKVTQKDHSLVILHDLKHFFGIGNISIDNRNSQAFKYVVSNVEHIVNIIIPHFDKYPLVGSKRLDYLDWKKAVLLNEDRLANSDFILSLKNKMNSKRSFDERLNFLNTTSIDLKPEWIQAYIDGEGSFQSRISDQINRGKPLLSIAYTLEIAQNTHDIKVLDAIRLYFGTGYLKPKYDIKCLQECKKVRSVSRFITYNTEIVTKFVDKYPMYTRKHLDYLDWKKLIDLKSTNTHKTEEGKLYMLKIKKGMNAGRLLNSNLLTSSDKLKFIRWSDIPGNKKDYHTKVNSKKSMGIKIWIFFKYFSIYILIILILLLSIIGYLFILGEDIENGNSPIESTYNVKILSENTDVNKHHDLSKDENINKKSTIWEKLGFSKSFPNLFVSYSSEVVKDKFVKFKPVPYPVWWEVTDKPTNPEDLEKWEKDLEVKKKWASLYPFLDEHYKETNNNTKDE